MEKQELIKILKEMSKTAYAISKDFEGENEKIAYGLKEEAWTLDDVIAMLEDPKYYETKKAIWLEGEEK